jgi:uncharacterized delta-60 repeat protein
MKKLLLIGLLFGSTQIYSQDGTLDTTFGNGGKVLTTVNGTDEKAYSLVIQPDGKIVVAGYTQSANSGSDFLCIRYNANGSLDTTFGTNGVATFDIQPNADDIAYSIDIDNTGKLFLAGYSNNGTDKNGAIIKLNTNGTLDTSFGTGGKVITDFTPTGEAIRQDEFKVVKVHHLTGKLIVGGNAYLTDTNSKPIFARYNSNGVLDITFNEDGKFYQFADPVSGDEVLYSIEDLAINQNGKITAVGWVKATSGSSSTDADHYQCRLNADGSADPSFSGDGYNTDNLSYSSSSDDRTYSMILNPDDSFYFGGAYLVVTNPPFNCIYAGHGSASGGTGGIYGYGYTTDDSLLKGYAISIDSHGKYIIGGTETTGTSNGRTSFSVMKFDAFSLDSTFGYNGQSWVDFDGSIHSDARDMKLQPDSKIVLAGFSGKKVALARLNGETLSTDEVAYKGFAKLYPNPATDHIAIDLAENNDTLINYIITDTNGRLISSGQLSGNKEIINVETLEKGIYFIGLEASGKTGNLKFIKK